MLYGKRGAISTSLAVYSDETSSLDGARKQPHMRAAVPGEQKKGREWKGMEGKEARKEKGLRTPFDQLGLINGVHGGVVDGDGERERRRREILFERAVGSVGLCY